MNSEREVENVNVGLFSTLKWEWGEPVSALGKIWVSCFMLILFHGLKTKDLVVMIPYGTLKPLGILMKNNWMAIIINLKLIFLKIILWLCHY